MWIRIGVDVCLWTAITIQESSLFCLHDWLYVFGFDEDGYRVESCHLQSLDGIPTDVQDTMLFLKKDKNTFINMVELNFIIQNV